MKLAEVLDSGLEENLAALSKKNSIDLTVSGYPGFLTDQTIISEFFSSHGFNMTSFYIAQRKRLGILLENARAARRSPWHLVMLYHTRFYLTIHVN